MNNRKMVYPVFNMKPELNIIFSVFLLNCPWWVSFLYLCSYFRYVSSNLTIFLLTAKQHVNYINITAQDIDMYIFKYTYLDSLNRFA